MRLNQVTVFVRDIDEGITFYRQLGLRLIVRSPHHARFVCPDWAVVFRPPLRATDSDSQSDDGVL